jgi:DNA-binding transcriptional regulator YdaS (Cro superfamily)
MSKTFTLEDRERLAAMLKAEWGGLTSAGSLYMALTGASPYSPIKCIEAERITKGELRRWHLRPKDWHLIWPEMVKVKGAPEVPAKEAA